jgi:type IV pilus assembly protein PilA
MKTNKKGFTLVELVIVIAVIAILAAVLLPTFAGIIDRANENASYQRARSTMDEVLGAEYYETLTDMSGMVFSITKGNSHYVYQVKDGGLIRLYNKNAADQTGTNVTVDAAGEVHAASGYTVTELYHGKYAGVTIYGVTVTPEP